MFVDADAQLDKILTLVAKCPQPLQERCFEILLTAYVNSKSSTLAGSQSSPQSPGGGTALEAGAAQPPSSGAVLPDAVRPRFTAMSARAKISAEKLAALFDFQIDPFTFHALAVPGDSKAVKTRNVALLLAAKGYLMAGSWEADWKEFRAVCVDQACYDKANNPTYLKNACFKTATAADGIALSSSGITAAEMLLAQLAGVSEN